MAEGFEAKPILDFALLPVEGGHLCGHGRKCGLRLIDGGAKQEVAAVLRVIEDVLEVVARLLGGAVFGEDGDLAAPGRAKEGGGVTGVRSG